MNSLSWLIYLADIVGSITLMLKIALVLAVPIMVVALGVKVFDHGQGMIWTGETREGKQASAEVRRGIASRILKTGARAAIPAVIALAVIPSSGTIYAIAASEMGETVLSSETGSKAVQALNSWLDRQIGEDGEPAPASEKKAARQ